MKLKKVILLAGSTVLFTSCYSNPPINPNVSNNSSSSLGGGGNSSINLDDAPSTSFIEVNGYKALSNNSSYNIVFENTNGKYEVLISKASDNSVTYRTDNSLKITIRDKGQLLGYNSYNYTGSYTSLTKKNYGYLLSSTIETAKGSKFLIEDAYYITSSNIFGLSRNVSVIEANSSDYGFESNIVFYEVNAYTDYSQFEYFIPAIIYKDTSNMASGICANMNLDKVYVKETRTGLPMVMVRHSNNTNGLALCHLEPNISIGTSNGGSNGDVDSRLEYGSVGIHIKDPKVGVGFTYPCYEGPVSYDSGGSKFHPIEKGFSHSYKLGLIPSNSADYNSAMVYSYQEAYNADDKYIADIDIDKVYSQNMEIFTNEYKEYTYNGSVVSAGFPYSLDLPSGTNSEGVSFAMGFVGQQIPAGYHLYNYGLKNNNSKIIKQGENILNFWSSSSVNSTYFPNIWYDPSNSANGGSPRNMPIYLRYIVDGMEGMIDAYLVAKDYGINKSNWYNTFYRVGSNLVAKQNSDGSFYRAYTTSGDVNLDKSDYRTQGDSPTNTPIAVRFLAKLYEITGEAKFKDAAIKAADYSYTNLYQKLGKYVGGTPDNPNTVDKEAAVYAMYCFSSAYLLTNDSKYLQAAEHAAICALSWTYTYDFVVPNAKAEDEGQNPFTDGGVIGFSLIATGHSAADNYSAYTYFETYKLYLLTGKEFYKNAALLLQNDTKLSSDYDGKIGYKYHAMTPEATRVADFAFSSVGTWLTWQGVANIEPIVDFEECFGVKDILKVTDSFETQLSKVKAYGCGGK